MSKNNPARSSRLILDNPALVLFLGAGPAAAMTVGVIPALGMAAALLLVMLLSGAVMCAIRNIVPERARIPAILIVTAFFVSVVQMAMNALLPTVYQAMGVYLAASAASLLVFYEAEQSANGRGFGASVLSALMNGIGFGVMLFVLAAVREVLGSGAFAGNAVGFFSEYNVPFLAQAPGGLLALGLLAAVLQKIRPAKLAGAGIAFAAAGIEETEEQEENV